MNRFKTAFFPLLIAGALAAPAGALAKDSSSALELAQQLNQAFVEVADRVSPAVVVITVVQKTRGRESEGDDPLGDQVPPELRRHFDGARPNARRPRMLSRGSGIVISEDGYILTNNHVVENAAKIRVRLKDGKEMDAEIVGVDPESDIAVIKIKANGLVAVKLGDSDKTRVGEFAIAIGAPFDLDYSVTVGHVSGKGRFFDSFSENYTDQDFIQTDASINPGNSGGPLINLYGEVIGINAMIRGLNTGIGFAIPINLAVRVKEHLVTEGKFTRSWIGVKIGELRQDTEFKATVPNLEDGVIIYEIEANSPAGKSKLKSGDVVVAVDGKPVKTGRQLKDEISTKKVGQTAALEVVRGNKRVTVKIKTEAALGEENEDNAKRMADAASETSNGGLVVQTLSKSLAEEYKVDMTPGVIVVSVEPDSPASDQGIKPRDIITEVNRKSVSNVGEFNEALKIGDPKQATMINLINNGASRFVLLKDGE